jgi:VWFA-related protein
MFSHVPFRPAVVACLMVSLGSNPRAVYAQEPSAEEPAITIRANTRLVVVDVVVTNKKGGPVTGLKADDFVLEENGKKQRIAVFTPPGAAQPAAQPLPPGILSNRPEYVRPTGVPTVLLLDAANSPFKDQSYGRSQMLKYVLQQAELGNPMAVMTLTDRLQVLQEFTSDPAILTKAIRNILPQEQVLQPAAVGTSANATAVAAASAGAALHGGGGNTAFDIAQAELAGFENLAAGYNLERRTVITIGAMHDLSRLLAGLPGRKNVVWLTAEFPFDLIPQDRNVSDAELLSDLPSVRQKSVGTTSAGAYASESRQMHGEEIKQAESQLAAASIAIYPVDMRGLVSGMEGTSAAAASGVRDDDISRVSLNTVAGMQASQGTMKEIAAETGGKAYVNQNDIKDGIALAVADEKASYTLGYYPENKKWDENYRSIKVKVNQGDIEVRYRRGYFAVDPLLEKGRNNEVDVLSALQIGSPVTQVSFMAQAKPTDPGKIRVVFLIDAHTLSADDSGGSKKMNVVLYATVFGGGKMLASHSIKVDKAFDAATYQQILDKGMMVPIDMEVPSGGSQLRLAVLDNKTGFVGSVSGPIGQ